MQKVSKDKVSARFSLSDKKINELQTNVVISNDVCSECFSLIKSIENIKQLATNEKASQVMTLNM